jgi:hypothetical protein
MTDLQCWLCGSHLEDLTFYVCRNCVKTKHIKNIEDFLVNKQDRQYYEWYRATTKFYSTGGIHF